MWTIHHTNDSNHLGFSAKWRWPPGTLLPTLLAVVQTQRCHVCRASSSGYDCHLRCPPMSCLPTPEPRMVRTPWPAPHLQVVVCRCNGVRHEAPTDRANKLAATTRCKGESNSTQGACSSPPLALWYRVLKPLGPRLSRTCRWWPAFATEAATCGLPLRRRPPRSSD